MVMTTLYVWIKTFQEAHSEVWKNEISRSKNLPLYFVSICLQWSEKGLLCEWTRENSFHAGLGLCINFAQSLHITGMSNSAACVLVWSGELLLHDLKVHGPSPRSEYFMHLLFPKHHSAGHSVVGNYVPFHGWENGTRFMREWWVVLDDHPK